MKPNLLKLKAFLALIGFLALAAQPSWTAFADAREGGVVIGNDGQDQTIPELDRLHRTEVWMCFKSEEAAARVLCPRAAQTGESIDAEHCLDLPRDRSTVVPVEEGQPSPLPELKPEHLQDIESIEALEVAHERAARGGSFSLLSFLEGESVDEYILRMAMRAENAGIDELAARIRRGLGFVRHGLVRLPDDSQPGVSVGQTVFDRPGSLPRPGHPLDGAMSSNGRCGIGTVMIREAETAGRSRTLKVFTDSRLLDHPVHGDPSKAVLWLREILFLDIPLSTNELHARAVESAVSNVILALLARGFEFEIDDLRSAFDDLKQIEDPSSPLPEPDPDSDDKDNRPPPPPPRPDNGGVIIGNGGARP